MKKIISLVSLAAILSVSLLTSAAPRESVKASCVLDPKDRYDLGWVFPRDSESRYRNQCVDTTIKRPTILLDVTDAGIRFANFFYKGHYYTATVPNDAVEKIYFQIAEFQKTILGIRAAHTQLRFFLKKGKEARLVPQSGGTETSIRDFVFSADYMAPKGVPYDLMRGFHPDFLTAARFVSTWDRVQQQVLTNKQLIRQYELNIKGRFRDQVLWASISLADQLGMTATYHTISMNCTTEAFRALYLGMEWPVPRTPWKPDSLFDPVIGSSLRRLERMKLIDDKSVRQTLNAEFGN